MNVIDAAFNVVHDYPGGAEALAPRMGKSGTSLSHEVARRGSAKFGLEDAVKATLLTGNPAIAHAFALAVGGVFIPNVACADDAGDANIEAVGEAVNGFGKAVTAFTASVADDEVTANELKLVDAAGLAAVERIVALMTIARQMYEAGKPSLQVVGGLASAARAA